MVTSRCVIAGRGPIPDTWTPIVDCKPREETNEGPHPQLQPPARGELRRPRRRGRGRAGRSRPSAETVHLADAIGGFLRDCRQCRRPDGSCAIDDGYRPLFHDRFLAADGLVVATPIYWYGMSAQLKAFFDRMFCYVAASYPNPRR